MQIQLVNLSMSPGADGLIQLVFLFLSLTGTVPCVNYQLDFLWVSVTSPETVRGMIG